MLLGRLHDENFEIKKEVKFDKVPFKLEKSEHLKIKVQDFEPGVAIDFESSPRRSKGKPKMLIDIYHKECRKMILKNNSDMEATPDIREKIRLQNLNNSLLQRLKKRR